MPQYLNQKEFINAIVVYNTKEFFKELLIKEVEKDDFSIELTAKMLAYTTLLMQKKNEKVFLHEVLGTFLVKSEKLFKKKAATDLDTVYLTTKTTVLSNVKKFLEATTYDKTVRLQNFRQEAKEQVKNRGFICHH